mgnify:FL=1
MQALLIYDIPDDKIRKKVADICLDYGLLRIQYSAFTGVLTTTRRNELYRKIEKVLGKNPGNVQIFPICQKDLEQRVEIINV